MSGRFVLDTDILTLYQQGHAAVVHNVQARPLDKLAVTIIGVGYGYGTEADGMV